MRRCALVVSAGLLAVCALSGCGSADEQARSDATAQPSGGASSDTGSASPGDSDGDAQQDKSNKADNDGEKKSQKSKKSSDKSAPSKHDNEKKSQNKHQSDNRGDNGGDKPGNTAATYCGLLKKTRLGVAASAGLARESGRKQITQRLYKMADVAPSNVRADWQRIASVIDDFLSTLAKYHVDVSDPKALKTLKPKARKEILGVVRNYQANAVKTSEQRVVADAKRRCGISLQ